MTDKDLDDRAKSGPARTLLDPREPLRPITPYELLLTADAWQGEART
ncbi:hypothetical protein ACVDG3_06890 [Meridianimarinicoccus sp. RP-17]|nr:hypothetical protein [Phycocomes zhengii]